MQRLREGFRYVDTGLFQIPGKVPATDYIHYEVVDEYQGDQNADGPLYTFHHC